MAGNSNLTAAAKAKNDEFYTQYSDIEAEMNAYVEFNPDVFRDKTILLPCDDPEWSNFTRYFATNFQRFGLKKLVCTSYAKSAGTHYQTSLLEENSPLYRPDKHATNGKLYTLTYDANGNGKTDLDDVEFKGYLKGDGDFRSDEVTRLRDEADIIITNPPFSLFREFIAWLMEADKQFVIMGNVNAITYKEVFPLLKGNKIWLGYSTSGNKKFNVPDDYPLMASKCGIDDNGQKFIYVKGIRWFANIDHGLRHQPLQLDTMAHNLKFNKKLKKKLEKDYGKIEYPHYDNYDAIEVPFVKAIPSDYDGIMGVPLTFLDKHCPEQFAIEGSQRWDKSDAVRSVYRGSKETADKDLKTTIHGKETYDRIFIRRRTRPTSL